MRVCFQKGKGDDVEWKLFKGHIGTEIKYLLLSDWFKFMQRLAGWRR